MKQLLPIFALSLTTTCSFAQKLHTNVTDEGGNRTIITSIEQARDFKDRTLFAYGVSVEATPKDTIYHLLLSITDLSPLHIKNNARLLIKTFEGSILELRNTTDADGSVRDIHHIGTQVFSDYTATAIYDCSYEQLETLAREGVAKIRVEELSGIKEKEYKKDKVGKLLRTDLGLISEALANQSDFDSDF